MRILVTGSAGYLGRRGSQSRPRNGMLMVAKATNKREPTKRRSLAEMAVILRDVPPGYNWGWFSREDPRMHLQTLDRKNFGLHKVWLEQKGKRVVLPEGTVPARVLKVLTAEIRRKRRHI